MYIIYTCMYTAMQSATHNQRHSQVITQTTSASYTQGCTKTRKERDFHQNLATERQCKARNESHAGTQSRETERIERVRRNNMERHTTPRLGDPKPRLGYPKPRLGDAKGTQTDAWGCPAQTW